MMSTFTIPTHVLDSVGRLDATLVGQLNIALRASLVPSHIPLAMGDHLYVPGPFGQEDPVRLPGRECLRRWLQDMRLLLATRSGELTAAILPMIADVDWRKAEVTVSDAERNARNAACPSGALERAAEVRRTLDGLEESPHPDPTLQQALRVALQELINFILAG